MARPRKDPNEGEERPRRRKRPPGDGEEQRQGPGNPDADPVRIHREYVERRTGGGAEPTQDAYARAIRQWHQLPGAVSAPATELSGEETARKPDDDEGEGEAETADDEEPR